MQVPFLLEMSLPQLGLRWSWMQSSDKTQQLSDMMNRSPLHMAGLGLAWGRGVWPILAPPVWNPVLSHRGISKSQFTRFVCFGMLVYHSYSGLHPCSSCIWLHFVTFSGPSVMEFWLKSSNSGGIMENNVSHCLLANPPLVKFSRAPTSTISKRGEGDSSVNPFSHHLFRRFPQR